jgi:hypothetical protein
MPKHDDIKTISTIEEVRLLGHIPRYSDNVLNELGSEIKKEAQAFIEMSK